MPAIAHVHQASSPETKIRSAFEQRFQHVVSTLAAAADLDVLTEALGTSDDISALAIALTSSVDIAPPRDPLAAARARGVLAREKLVERAGGMLRVSDVANRLGVSTQAVQARRARGTLLAVPLPNGEHVYPAVQFTEGGVLDGLSKVLARFRDADPWTRTSVLLAPSARHDGQSAFDLLRSGEVEAAQGIAARYGEHLG